MQKILGLSSLFLKSEYRTGEHDLGLEFYNPCLSIATKYDRAVGYFRSTVFVIIGNSLIDFAKRGGRIRLVCSPHIEEADHDAMVKGYRSRDEVVEEALEKEFEYLLSVHSLKSRTDALATLITRGTLDIRIALREGKVGIFHEKMGIFSDSTNEKVSFKGSANESWHAWHANGNFESFEVFRSWIEKDSDRVVSHAEYFERLWSGNVPELTTLPFPAAAKRKLCIFAKGSLEELDVFPDEENEGAPERKKKIENLFPHQIDALSNWNKLGCRGLLKHATGSGKTVTALAAIREHASKEGLSLVLVPSRLLLRQWFKEIGQEIPGATIVRAGDGHVAWRENNRLARFCSAEHGNHPAIVLATMQTASSPDFLRLIKRGEKRLLLIADEAHQSGSPEFSNLFSINAAKRLGLSATPERFGDIEGTETLFNYFGGIVPPEFTLADAIRSERLVPYEYFPSAVSLSAEEAADWKALSKEISREIARISTKEKCFKMSDRARSLLIRRSRIAKKASAKLRYIKRVLMKVERDQRWLIYCEDADQLTDVVASCREMNLDVCEYHTSMQGSSEASLAWFRKFGGVMVSIRCLDEGIDIPEITHAIILASSQNPRQFIQRRGRVLRRSDGKSKAVLYDVLVVPVNVEIEPEQSSLLKAELCRAIAFAEGAMNKSAASELRTIAIAQGLDINQVANVGTEGMEEDKNG